MSSTVCPAQRYCWPRLAKFPVSGSSSPIRTSLTGPAARTGPSWTATNDSTATATMTRRIRMRAPPYSECGKRTARDHGGPRPEPAGGPDLRAPSLAHGPRSVTPSPLRGEGGVRGGLVPRDYPPGELLAEAPLLVPPGGEHQLAQPAPLELADALDQLVGLAPQAGGAYQLPVDQWGLARVEIGVVALVGAEVAVGARDLLHQRAVARPDAPQEGRHLDAALVHRIVEVVEDRKSTRLNSSHPS